jgi:hypothetical protein
MAEPKKEKKPKKPVPALPDRFTEQDMRNIRARQIPSLKESAQGVLGAAVAAEATDPFLSRNEFKPGFYDQPKPPVSYETLKGTAAKPIPNVTDTESFAEGGSVRGQKNIQVKKKQFRGVF